MTRERSQPKPRKPLKPMSDKRLAELREAGIVYPASTLVNTRKPVKTKAPKDTGPDAATVDAVLERDGYACVVCGCFLTGRRGVDYSIHHRKRRSQGGDNRTSNLISVCGHGTAGCHGDIHAAPAKAREAGWLLRRTDPTSVVMAHSQHGWSRLDDQAGLTRVPEKEIPDVQ